MIKQFVQVSAHKDSNNFAHCSNLSLMSQGLSYNQSLRKLQVMADEYALNGYKIEWITQALDPIELEMYADILVDH